MTANATLNGVTKRYGPITAVSDVSLALDPGEIIALVGHNGAGKTTLIKMMLGLAHPSEGSIRVLGENPAAGEFAARRRLGYLPENVAFNGSLSGREILAFYVRLKGERPPATLALLERVGLEHAADRRLRTYSKGMRQRLGLAQALIGEPQVLLLDEPTTGLDPALRFSFYDIIRELRGRGTTVVLSSHALTELEERTDRIVIMNRGAVVADGSIDDLRRLAELPAKIRITAGPGGSSRLSALIGPVAGLREINGHILEFDASGKEKIALLRKATEDGSPIEDVAVVPPTLDELYAHFLLMPGGPP